MSLRKSSSRRNGSKSEVLPNPNARRRCTPAPSVVGFDFTRRFTGRMDIPHEMTCLRGETQKELGTRYWVRGTGFEVLGSRYWVRGTGYEVQGLEPRAGRPGTAGGRQRHERRFEFQFTSRVEGQLPYPKATALRRQQPHPSQRKA